MDPIFYVINIGYLATWLLTAWAVTFSIRRKHARNSEKWLWAPFIGFYAGALWFAVFPILAVMGVLHLTTKGGA